MRYFSHTWSRFLVIASREERRVPDGLSLPEELSRREKRLAVICEAKAELERRSEERYQIEQQPGGK